MHAYLQVFSNGINYDDDDLLYMKLVCNILRLIPYITLKAIALLNIITNNPNGGGRLILNVDAVWVFILILHVCYFILQLHINFRELY